MPLYLDLDVFHMRDHKDRGGPEAGNLQPQFKNSENFVFIFQIRKQQETRKKKKILQFGQVYDFMLQFCNEKRKKSIKI